MTLRLVGGAGAGIWNRLVPHPHVVVKNLEKYLGYGGSSWGVRSPSSTPGFSAWSPALRRGVPTIFGSVNQWVLHLREIKGYWSSRHSSSRAHVWTYFLMNSLALSSNRGILGGIVWDGETALSRTKLLTGAIVPLLSPSPTQPAGTDGHQISVSNSSHHCDFLRTCFIQPTHQTEPPSVTVPHKMLASAHAAMFP